MIKRLPLVAAVCVLSLMMTACDRDNIGDIVADPGRYQGKKVTVAGRVTNVSVGALSMGLYQIDDGTGRLYVLSESRGAPSEGAYVGVQGTVTPTITFLGRNYATVLRETGREAARPPK